MPYRLFLKELRKKAGLKQQEVAEQAGIKLSTYRTWEQGVAKKIPLEAACSICEVLGCTPNDLCGWYIDNPQDAPVAKADVHAGLSRDEAVLISDYRSCTPERKRWVADAARDQQRLSQEQDTAGESFAEAV